MRLNAFLTIIFLLTVFGCKKDPIATLTSQAALMQPGDIIIVNNISGKVDIHDSDGNYKSTLAAFNTLRDSPWGVKWDATNGRILVSVNGTPDRVMAYDPYDGSATEAVNNGNLNGTIYGLAALDDGEILVVETNNGERFDSAGNRIGNPFAANLMTQLRQFDNVPNGGFIACATSTDRVRLYDDNGVQLAQAQSGIGGTTNPFDCRVTSTGNIIVPWSGTTDTVILYNSDLSAQVATYSDTSLLPDPIAVAETLEGHFLVVDGTREYIVELDSSLRMVRILNSPNLNNAYGILVVPQY